MPELLVKFGVIEHRPALTASIAGLSTLERLEDLAGEPARAIPQLELGGAQHQVHGAKVHPEDLHRRRRAYMRWPGCETRAIKSTNEWTCSSEVGPISQGLDAFTLRIYRP